MLDRRYPDRGRHHHHRDFIPSVDGTVVRRLREAGVVLLGVQLVAGHLREDLLVRAGRAFQNSTDWHTRRPPVS